MKKRVINIPCATSRVGGGKWVSTKELRLININMPTSGTLLSRYWKGIEGDHSTAVIVVEITDE